MKDPSLLFVQLAKVGIHLAPSAVIKRGSEAPLWRLKKLCSIALAGQNISSAKLARME